MNILEDSLRILRVRADRDGRILHTNKGFRRRFPQVMNYRDFVHQDDWEKIPKPESCQKHRFSPVDVIVLVKTGGQWYKACFFIGSSDSLIFECIGFIIEDRSLSDDEINQKIREWQSHQARRPIASILGALEQLEPDMDKADFYILKSGIVRCVQEYDTLIRTINDAAS